MIKVKLNIIGLTYSQSRNSAYALLLGEENGKRQLPIVIGSFEAQSIAIALEEDLVPSRPLSHDLFTSIALTFNLYLKSIVIHKLKEGVFYSYLIFEQDGITKQIDSRTSDAVALAVRFNCPIYTYQKILDKAGVFLNENITNHDNNIKLERSRKLKNDETSSLNLIRVSDKELQKRLIIAIEKENYKQAASLRDEINRRNAHK